MQSYLEDLAVCLNIQNHIVFTGHLSNQELTSLIMNANVVVKQSKYESFGFSVAEEVSLGKPVVQAYYEEGKKTELPFVKNNVNGFVVKFGDVKDLATKIKDILLDYNLQDSFSKNSEMIARSFKDWSQVSKEYCILLTTILAKSK